MIACGKICLYNAYLPGGKHEARKQRKIEDIYTEITEEEISRNYLIMELGGTDCSDDAEISMPPIKYQFA